MNGRKAREARRLAAKSVSDERLSADWAAWGDAMDSPTRRERALDWIGSHPVVGDLLSLAVCAVALGATLLLLIYELAP